MKPKEIYHKAVLINEVLQYLDPGVNKIYVDATFGGGGHTQAILEKEPGCKVIGIDWDEKALEHGQALQEKYEDRLKLLWGNFAQIYKLLKKEKIAKIDGLLADFGTSQFQIQHKAGFSFQQDSLLDMRMSPAHGRLKASDILNKTPEKELAKIFFELGEETNSRKIARAIAEKRKTERFKTTLQLAKLIENILPYKKDKKIHPATKTFQALRIFVNKELENINALLHHSINFLNPNGRLVFISFHSLEDRIVKTFFKENSDKLKILTPKAIIASAEEKEANPSARSAKLRAAQKQQII